MARKQKTAAQKAKAKATCERRINEARQQTVDQIIELMERDGLNWHKDWTAGKNANVFDPCNPITGTHYRGGNLVHLACQCIANGIDDNRFATAWEAKKQGWTLRDDAKPYLIEKWKRFTYRRETTDAAGNVSNEVISYYKPVSFFWVYNYSDIDGAPELVRDDDRPVREREELDDLIDALEETSRCRMTEDGGDRAFYRPMADEIHVPLRDDFETLNGAIRTYLHEMGHSTGHRSVFDRKGGKRKGDADYAYEELIAELTAVFCAAYLGCDLGEDFATHRENHTAYIKSWLKSLRNDTSYVYRAAAEASKACDYIIDRLTQDHPEYKRDHTDETVKQAA